LIGIKYSIYLAAKVGNKPLRQIYLNRKPEYKLLKTLGN
jgi:hypothetical protein